jgi:hypothetical protein
MAICHQCNREMKTADTCSVKELHRAGAAYPVFRCGDDPGWKWMKGRCGDCGVLPGGFHHLGCDIQVCPGCRRQLITCDCDWDELPGRHEEAEEEEDVIGLDLPAFRPAPVRTVARPPLAAVAAPIRAKHHESLRRLAAWSLAHGRSCDLDVAALCVDALDRYRSTTGRVLLDRPTVHQIQWADLWNLSQILGTLLPEQWPMDLWTILGWLDDEDLLDPGSAPLAVLREPLRCYGALDETGRPMPEDTEPDIACQCYIPYDPSLPPGIGQHIVGHDPETFEQFLVQARLRPRSTLPTLADLEPLYIFARRLRRERSGIEIHVEEFTFLGVAPADATRSELWLYRRDATRKSGDPLVLDATGGAWLPQRDRRRRLGYRWVAANDTVAVFRAGGRADTTEDD